jgi:outer membrane protein OmpA-like peptidoglycan-associated protein
MKINKWQAGALAIVAFSNIAIANDSQTKDQVYITPFFDYINISDKAEKETGVGVDIGYRMEDFGYRARFEKVSGQGKDNQDSASGINTGLDLVYHSFNQVYLFTGLRHNKLPDSDFSAALGGGFEYSLTKNWDFRVEVGAMGYLDKSPSAIFANLGVTYRFEKETQRSKYVPPKPKKVIKTEYITLDVKFLHDSSVIDTVYEEQIARIAYILLDQANSSVIIEGHTSLIGSDEYNMALSQRRADAVVNRIINDYGVNKNQLKAIGYGESLPISKLSGKAGAAENRRVVAAIKTTKMMAIK